MIKTRKCSEIISVPDRFERTKGDPDEECINCILDDILDCKEGETRDGWISLYRQGLMGLNCARTGKSYLINKEFFDKIFKNH